MSSKQEAELRRSNEELINAYRQLKEQNRLLREQNQKLRATLKGAPVKPALEPAPAPKADDVLGPGRIVHYVDKAGHVHNALVLEVLEDGMLRLKVFRQATPNVTLDARRGQNEKQRGCWRTK